MLKIPSAATLLVIASVSLAQTAQPGQATPSVTPSQTPIVTPSQAPAVTPSQAPVINPQVDSAPVVGGPAPTIGGIESRPIVGLSPCENLLAFEREKCLQAERSAATGATTTPPTSVPGAPMSVPGAPADSSAPMSPAAPAAADEKTRGPEATGATSGASSSGASTGTSGGAAPGGAAPR
jgi:hypothetical protein